MVICERPAMLFVHIPKTAGMSITRTLTEGSLDHRLCHPTTKHETVSGFVARHGRATFERFTSFAVVRHPLDRFLSRYAFTSTRQAPGAHDQQLFTSPQAFIAAIERSDPLLMARPERWRPQADYLLLDGTIAVQRVLRFEALDAEFGRMCAELGLPPRTLLRRNRSDRTVAPPSEDVAAFVGRYYRRDFDLFGYDPDLRTFANVASSSRHTA